MVAYNFQSQFVEAIRNGNKLHTIRKNGKRRHARPGEMLQLYTGMRTTSCHKIIPDPECVFSVAISIAISVDAAIDRIMIGDNRNVITNPSELDLFAVSDGFTDAESMGQFWLAFHGHGLFKGTLIGWEPIGVSIDTSDV